MRRLAWYQLGSLLLLASLLMLLGALCSRRLLQREAGEGSALLLGSLLAQEARHKARRANRTKVNFPVIRNYSGADTYFERLARGVSAQGIETDLRFYPHILEFLPYTVLRHLLPARREDGIVHTKAEYGWLFAAPCSPLVVTLAHSVFATPYEAFKKSLQRLYHNQKLRPNIRRSFDLADRIVTVSRFSAGCIFDDCGRRDVRVIYNGVDENFFRPGLESAPPSHGPVRLLYTGNCTVRKGFDLLGPIMDCLGRGFQLEYTSGLRSFTKGSSNAAMRPLGRLSEVDLLAAYQRCDIFLFPSRLEGFGYPVAEAMACGKPVVCTNCSSLPELIDDSQGGYLCPANNVDAFADRIRRLGCDPDLRHRMGAYNRTKVEKQFSLARCLKEYVALYEELL